MSEIGVKLTGDNAEFRGMLADSVAHGENFATQIAGKVGDKLYGLRDVSHTVSTALGLNLESIAEKAARLFSGLSKEEEEFYKKSGELGAQATDLAIKNIRAQASEETQYQLLLKERDAALARINQRNADSLSVEATLAESRAAAAKYERERTAENEAAAERARLRYNEAIKQEQDRAAILAANSADQLKAEQAIAEIQIHEAARKKADDDRSLQAAKDNAEITKKHDEEQKKALGEEDKITAQIFEGQTKQIEAGEKLLAQAKARAIAESNVATEFDRQLATILKMKPGTGSSSPGGFSLNNESPQLAAARAALKSAENAPNDFTNPNYTRDLFQAQLLVSDLQLGGSGAKSAAAYGQIADSALGSREQNATAKATAEAAAAAKENARINKRIETSLNNFFGSLDAASSTSTAHAAPPLSDTSYPSFTDSAGGGNG